MTPVVTTLLNLMRFRSGPQDLPASRGLLLGLVILYLAQGFLAGRIIDEPDAGPRTIVAIALQFAAIAVLLNLRGLHARTQQTLSAMAGTGFLFGLLSLAVLSRIDPASPQPNLALFYLALFVWSLLVDGHIYRHALSIKLGGGVLIAVLIFAVNFILLRLLFA
jgi:hypothetical protein